MHGLWRLAALGAGIALFANPALAADAQESPSGPVDNSAWVQSDMDDAYAVDNLTNLEKQNFGFQFQNSGFRNCDGFPFIANSLPISYALSQTPGLNSIVENLNGKTTRRFLRDPKYGKLFLDDELEMAPTVGASRELATAASRIPLFMFGSVTLDGTTGVAQPMPEENSCDEIKHYLKLTTFKTVLPLNGSRIGAMIPGEIWRIPVTFSLRVGPSAGYSPTGTAPGLLSGIASTLLLQGVNVIVSGSVGASKTATVTLRRLDENTLRARIRLGEAKILDGKGQVLAAPPMLNIVGPAVESALGSAVGSYLAETILMEISSEFTLDYARSSGDTAILEYLLNPNDAKQMDALAGLLKGDLDIFKQLVKFKGILKPDASAAAQEAQLSAVADRHTAALGADPNYAGMMTDKSRVATMMASVPFVGTASRIGTRAHDSYVQFGEQGGSDDHSEIITTARTSSWGIGTLPLVENSAMLVRNHSRSAQTLLTHNADGSAQVPSAVYIDQVGALRRVGKVAPKDLEQVNSIMRYVGTHGEGIDSRMEIPLPAVMSTETAKGAKGFALNFSLYLSSNAIQSILSASKEDIEKAYLNAFPAAPRTGFAAPLTALADAHHQKQEERLVGAIQAASAAPDNASAAADLDRLWGGKEKGIGNMSFADVYKVVLQLVSPSDVAAEVTWGLATKISQSNNSSLRFLYNPDLFNGTQAQDFGRMKSRYIAPQPLSD
jgi:hypothetical protein